MRRLVLAAAVSLAALAWSPRGGAALVAGPDGASVSAGHTVGLRVEVPGSASEWEVVLSLDGGESFPIRVTREETAAGGLVPWTVPLLATSRAVLELRGEIGGVERVLARSAPFRIEPRPVPAALEPRPDRGELRRRGDGARIEWWSGFDSPLHSRTELPASGIGGAGETLAPLDDDVAALGPKGPDEGPVPAATRPRVCQSGPGPLTPSPVLAASALGRAFLVPLRN